MQAKDLRARLRSSSLRAAARPALYVLGFTIAAASCAAELEDPDRYKVAIGTAGNAPAATGGSPPAASGGTTSTGGTVGTTGGTVSTTGGSASGMVTTVDACVKTAFTNNICTSCHSASGKASAANLDLTGSDAAIIASLKDVAALKQMATNAAACGTMLINSANPAESVLLKRVKGSGDCGPAMPFAPGVTGPALTCIQDWVMKF